jgi:phosphoribosylaminoimidazolecarboxamide formyltransferase/IMP cyclohydrolase
VSTEDSPAAEPATEAGDRQPVRRALVSVYDKTGLAELARGLHAAGVTIVSTGSTAATIADAGVPVTEVADVTGFPEVLDGRVKTLHPGIHAGLLADRRRPQHVATLADLGYQPYDLLVSNLYPFSATVASGASPEECIEKIDIGGPAMIRAGAKNHSSVAVVVSADRYGEVLEAVGAGGFTLADRQRLAAAAFAHTASYDVAVAGWFAQELATDEAWWPRFAGVALQRRAVLRYGENPHQAAALYADAAADGDSLATAEQLHGKPMSYNNYVDTDAALRAAHGFHAPAVAIIKHANPCGIAIGGGLDPIADAHAKAHACDPVSAFGGVIAANRPVTKGMAEQIAGIFTEVVVAPEYEPVALEMLRRKRDLRILRTSAHSGVGVEFRQICGGVLVQTADRVDEPGDRTTGWTLVAGDPLDTSGLADLELAWHACRAVKSNAILLADDGATVGIGMGQVNRVDAARLAVSRAGERAVGSVGASDAYFPFPDGLQVLIDAGVRAVVQPGGSIRDDEVIAAAKAGGITMYLTGVRHFAH